MTQKSIPVFAAGVSANAETSFAIDQACTQCLGTLSSKTTEVDFAVVSYTSHHIPESHLIAERVKAALRAKHVIGISTHAVIGGSFELEGTSGLSILAGHLPQVQILPITSEELPMLFDSPQGQAKISDMVGGGEGLSGLILLADPFSTPVVRTLPTLHACIRRRDGSAAPIIGGMASSGHSPGENTLLSASGEPVQNAGFVGLALRGPIRLDAVVSQGCAPLGPNLVITKANRNLIMELGGRNALDVVREILDEVPEENRQAVRSGLFLGRVINEYREQFGRGDYLIRPIMGVDETTKAIAVGDLVRAGQTVRLHVRDAVTAKEDLAMLMDMQRLHGSPAGCLLVSCNGRGHKLYGRANVDSTTVANAFDPVIPGERRAKIGHAIDTDPGPVPLAGFFAQGEFGPIGAESYLHNHTAVATMFRAEN